MPDYQLRRARSFRHVSPKPLPYIQTVTSLYRPYSLTDMTAHISGSDKYRTQQQTPSYAYNRPAGRGRLADPSDREYFSSLYWPHCSIRRHVRVHDYLPDSYYYWSPSHSSKYSVNGTSPEYYRRFQDPFSFGRYSIPSYSSYFASWWQ